MVVFTCNNCSESIQKPRVIKHISYECKRRNARVSLCCIDCLKDFDSNTYVDHTKCLTELERYSGSNYTPKSSSNKGERKQNSWISVVRSVLDQPSLNHNQRELLQAISHFENVPRKKLKFQNFIKSSIRHLRVSPHVIETVFELLDEEFKNSTTSVPETTKLLHQNGDEAEKRSSCTKENDDTGVCEENDVEKTRETLEKESKKERVQTDENETTPTDEIVSIKKQKKKKRKEKNDVDVVAPENETLVTVHDECEKPVKEVHDENNSSGDIANDSQVMEKKKKKKKKTKKFDNTESENVSENVTQSILSESRSIPHFGDQKENEKVLKNIKNQEKIDEKCSRLNGNNLEESNGEEVFVIKRSKKRELEIDHEVENEVKCDEKQAVNAEKNKKRKFKTEHDSEENTADDSETVVKRKKTKKHHPEDLVSEMDHQNTGDGEDSTSKFDWKAVVIAILLESKNRELSLKKMKKKIAKKYLQFYQDGKSSEDIIKKFDKRVKKITNVTVNEERIRLLE